MDQNHLLDSTFNGRFLGTNSRGCPGGNRENEPDCTARQDYAHSVKLKKSS